MITVYGAAQSRAFRTLWMLEELGIDYQHVPTAPSETRSPDFLAINPNGHVPVLVDGDLTLVESMAINLYLAARHGGALWPDSVQEQGIAYQWSFWVLQELEAHLLTALRQRVLVPEAERDEAAAAAAADQAQAPLRVLDGALEGRDHLAGSGFTVADLNVAAVLSWAKGGGVSLDAYPNISRWFGDCFGRPARRAAAKK